MSLRVLFVDDSPDDIELMLRRLQAAGLEPLWASAQDAEALRGALAAEEWQVALVDYDLPGFGGLQALRILGSLAPDVPAITVSGAIDEDAAVATLSAGAVDYVLKGNLTRLVTAVRRALDDAERRRLQRQDAEQARRALRVIERASQAIAYIDAEGIILYANESACRLEGISLAEAVGRDIWAWHPPVDRDGWRDLFRAAADGPLSDLEIPVRPADGRERLFSVTLEHAGEDGAGFVVAYMHDITERKRAETALRESEARLSRAQSIARVGNWELDLAAHRMWASEETFRVYGVERATPWLPLDLAQTYVLPEYRSTLDRALQRLIQGAGDYDEEFEIRRPVDGEVRFVHSRAELILTDAGRPQTVVGAVQDITERKAAEHDALEATARLRRAVDGAVLAMSQVVEARDPYTAGHERRVSELATAIAREMGMTGEELTGVRLGSLIHDVGKIAVPAEILAKPGRLNEVEFSLVKQHAQAGYDILAAIDFDWPVAEMALQHHERLDGSGYPRALRAADILLEAKILAVADVVEAMSSHRPYRATLGMPAALAEIREHAGVKFDAGVVAACVRVVEEQGFMFAS